MVGLRQPGFIERLFRRENETFDIRCMILTSSSELWSALRAEVFIVLKEAATDRQIQENAYDLLYWFDYILRNESGHEETTLLKKLLSDPEISGAIWKAAVAAPLSPRGVAQIRDLPNQLKALGVEVTTPAWWDPVLAALNLPTDLPDSDQPENPPE